MSSTWSQTTIFALCFLAIFCTRHRIRASLHADNTGFRNSDVSPVSIDHAVESDQEKRKLTSFRYKRRAKPFFTPLPREKPITQLTTPWTKHRCQKVLGVPETQNNTHEITSVELTFPSIGRSTPRLFFQWLKDRVKTLLKKKVNVSPYNIVTVWKMYLHYPSPTSPFHLWGGSSSASIGMPAIAFLPCSRSKHDGTMIRHIHQ